MIDEKGRLFGKLNIVDLLVILVVLVAVVVLGVKFLGKDGGGGINPGKTHIVKTDKFELANGTILSCVWEEN